MIAQRAECPGKPISLTCGLERVRAIEPALAPIIVGVNGADVAEEDHRVVSAALAAMFDRLDARYRWTPKILLTMLAQGADILAAEAVVDRADWTIVAPLSMSIDLHLQDFDDSAAAAFRAVVETAGAREKLRLFVLDPLHHKVESRSVTADELAHSPSGTNPDRIDHHAQAELFIADRCAVLIALPRPHQKRQNTARIMSYRLRGVIDAATASVIRRSRYLFAPPLLGAPLVGPVWLVDHATGDPVDGQNAELFQVLLPPDQDVGSNERLRESLRLADWLHDFNLRTRRERAGASVSANDSTASDTPAAMLCRLMDALSAIQIGMNRKHKWSVWWLSVAFFVAVVMLEVQLDLNQSWGVFGYVGALATGIAVYRFASASRWQSFAQDYRAVAEVLRVQIAWWNGGLTAPRDQVHRFYLGGAAGSLALVRAVIRHLVDAAWLLQADAPPTRPQNATTRGERAVLRWVDEQSAYFQAQIRQRQTRVSFIDAMSWFLIVASLSPEVLYAVNAVAGDLVQPLFESIFARFRPGVVLVLALAIIVLIFIGGSARWMRSSGAWTPEATLTFETPSMLLTALAGLVLTIGLYDGAAVVRGGHASGALLTLGGFSTAAIAWSMQFVSSQLCWAEELRGYEDALEAFRKARAALDDIDEEADPAERTARRQAIIAALGREALNESETWLRTHRDRPLEPLPPT